MTTTAIPAWLIFASFIIVFLFMLDEWLSGCFLPKWLAFLTTLVSSVLTLYFAIEQLS